jgi:uncharacterized protein YndB with AHSA1/START domain
MMAVTATAKPSLSIVRRIRATPEKVFAYWTEPALMGRWFGPDGIVLRSVEADARLGGRFRIVMQEGEDGEVHDVSGTYRAFEPGRKLVFSWAWITMPERESLVTLEFRPIDEGTELTLTHSQFADEAARDSHRQGWTPMLDKLVDLFEGE